MNKYTSSLKEASKIICSWLKNTKAAICRKTFIISGKSSPTYYVMV